MFIQQDFSHYLAVYFALLLFGVIYNAIIEHIERNKYIEGFTSLAVVLGVAVTVLACGFLVGWLTVGIVSLGFAFSGLPMVIGSVVRYVRARAVSQKMARDE
jgi:predicted tellurium resistance membrane protein TerC